MALRSPLVNLRGGNPKRGQVSRSWKSGLREADGVARRGGLHRTAAAREEETATAGGDAEAERAEEIVAAPRRRVARPAAALRFVWEAVEQGAKNTG